MMRLVNFRSRNWIGEKSVLMRDFQREGEAGQFVASHTRSLNPPGLQPSPYGLPLEDREPNPSVVIALN